MINLNHPLKLKRSAKPYKDALVNADTGYIMLISEYANIFKCGYGYRSYFSLICILPVESKKYPFEDQIFAPLPTRVLGV